MRPIYRSTLITPEGKRTPCHLHADNYIKEARDHIGGWIEQRACYYQGQFSYILMDEEGRLKNLPINPTASEIVGYPVVGSVIFRPRKLEKMYD